MNQPTYEEVQIAIKQIKFMFESAENEIKELKQQRDELLAAAKMVAANYCDTKENEISVVPYMGLTPEGIKANWRNLIEAIAKVTK